MGGTLPPKSHIAVAYQPCSLQLVLLGCRAKCRWAFCRPHSSKLYVADLESAMHYTLRVEAGRPAVLAGAQLAALKCYVATLAKVRSWEGNHLHGGSEM